jgi:RNA-directed DNA polymerase
MQESYGEGVASHTDPESCGGARKSDGEALTGVRAGRAIEPRNENLALRRALRGADALGVSGRLHRESRQRERLADPARSKTPCMYGNTSRGSREIPSSPGPTAGRIGKSNDVRR